ncbi:very long chain fatty acid elongase 4-like [Branchiostoma floridae x Branchiostoma belcheri]
MTTVLRDAADYYTWMVENGDPRTDPWFLVYSPLPIFVLFVLYVLLCVYGPRVMEKRQPFNLKTIIIPYNFALVGLSAYMFYEFLVTAWLSGYSLKCQPVDYSTNDLPMRMARVCWWFFFSKVIELMDTVFFIMRKKSNQVTFLHVYHHCTMIINWWLGVKYVAGGQPFFLAMLNSFIHTVMYLYYGMAAIGPHMQKYLWWKRYLTSMQLMQFVAILTHTTVNFFSDCDFPQGFNIAVMAYMVSLIILFGNFYYQEYVKRARQKKQ